MEDVSREQGRGVLAKFRRTAFLAMTSLIAFLLLVIVGLLIFQHGMIYFPRPYEPSYRMGFPAGMIELEFQTSAGTQVAFYQAPSERPESPPDRLWVLVGGNASLALDWVDLLQEVKDPRAGYLLVDYPGYGKSSGKASSKRMMEGTEGALAALAMHINVSPDQLEQDINYVGHSMGCAAVLQLAARHKANKILLLAPFTSLADMARLTVGWPLCHTLLDHYDNRRRLDELAERISPPDVHIFHGSQDNIVPFRMGQELAERHPTMITFHPIQGGDHNWVLEMSRKEMLRLMREAAPRQE